MSKNKYIDKDGNPTLEGAQKAAELICHYASLCNSDDSTFTLHGLKIRGEDEGDWKVEIKKVKGANES